MKSAQESAARWLKLDEICDQFEAAYLSEAPPRVEEFLNEVPADRRDETIRELLKVDAHYRQKSDDIPSVAEYQSRFPDVDSLWLRTLLSPPSPRLLPDSPDSLFAMESFQSDPTGLPVVPGYDVMELIGCGGMGVVYKARQFSLNRLVALKMVLAGELASPETLARFRAEARAVAQLQHPNLVQIYEVGDHQGRPYLAFEFVAGGSLDQRLRGIPQRPSAAASLVQTLAQAIQFAHVRGIVHRDLKPANILLATNDNAPSSDSRNAILTKGPAHKTNLPTPIPAPKPQLTQNTSVENSKQSGGELARVYGIPKISDFGLAKDLGNLSQQTKSGAILGTPSYMAPEQAAGKTDDIGPATDVYALGAILYEMLSGRPPFLAPTIMETLDQVRSLEPISLRRIQPAVPRDLDTICLKCLHKDPARRYVSAVALADDLDRFLRYEPVVARPVSTTERTWRWCRRRPLVATMTLLLILVSGGGIAGIIHQWKRAEVSRELAENNARAARTQRDEAQSQRLLADANRQLAEQNAEIAEEHRRNEVIAREESENSQKLAEISLVRAEARFGKSRSAINELLKVGRELIRKPQMDSYGREVLETANRLQESLLAEKSSDPATQLETARAKLTFGWTQYELGQNAEAEETTLRGIAIVQSLLSEIPETIEALREMRNAVSQLAHIQSGSGRRAEADKPYRESIRRGQEVIDLANSRPDDHFQMANVLTNFATGQSSLGHPADARASLERAEGMMRRLVDAQPRSERFRAGLALALSTSARMEWNGDRNSAEKLAREALEIRRRLLAEQPKSRELPGYLARSSLQVADLCLASGHAEEAEMLLKEAFELLLQAVSNHPRFVGLRHRLRDVSERWRGLAKKRGDTEQADLLLKLECENARILVTNLPDSTPDRLKLAEVLTASAGRHVELSDKPNAAKRYLEAIREYNSLLDVQDEKKYRAAIPKLIRQYTRLGRDFSEESRVITLWEDWLRRSPEDIPGLNSLAWSLCVSIDTKLRDPARAVELARKVVEREPAVASYHNTLGVALYRIESLIDAQAEFEKSLELRSGDSGLDRYFLAAIMHRSGRLEEARDLFQRAQIDHQRKNPASDDYDLIAAEVKAVLDTDPAVPQ